MASHFAFKRIEPEEFFNQVICLKDSFSRFT